MKTINKILITILLVSCQPLFAQSYNEDRVSLTNFLTRMYNNAPFEGVRVVNDYDNNYLLSILSLDKTKYPNDSAMIRVASVKAMSQASRFFNGSSITSDLIIRTSEKSDGTGDTEIIENIREHSVGYVQALELLTTFAGNDGWQVFIFCKRLDLK